ncbi:MAG TPA: DNA-processing protein DprA, partial [Gemmatimonadaceae bacterium]|nr:DNA-processing protein DprA [Gemmatimonadaceae bacterium]
MRFRELVAVFGSPAQAWDATPPSLERDSASENAKRAMQRASDAGAQILVSGDTGYPERLLALPDPPPVIFAIGSVECVAGPCVAIVGTRRATSYGERVTTELAGALARAGVTVVSGMARGIDSAAHRAALAVGGI